MEKYILKQTQQKYNSKSKNDTNFVNYHIYDKTNNKVMINIENIYIPFGYEYYNKSCFLNIELKQNNEEHVKIIEKIKSIESNISEEMNDKIINVLKI